MPADIRCITKDMPWIFLFYAGFGLSLMIHIYIIISIKELWRLHENKCECQAELSRSLRHDRLSYISPFDYAQDDNAQCDTDMPGIYDHLIVKRFFKSAQMQDGAFHEVRNSLTTAMSIKT